MNWILNIVFTGLVYKATSEYETNSNWLNTVIPLIVSTASFYLQWLWQLSFPSVKSFMWALCKVFLIQTVMSFPLISLDLWLPVKHILTFVTWATSFMLVLAPSTSKWSPWYYIGKIIGNLGFSNPFRTTVDKSMEEVDKLGNNGKDFEAYMATVYKGLGFSAWTTTELRASKNLPKTVLLRGGSGEQGVDVVVYFPQARQIGNGVYDGLLVQCKQYSSTVGNKAIQEIFSAIPMYSQHFKKRFKPVVVTNNYFTKQAMDLAMSNGVNLMNREQLASLIKDANQQDEPEPTDDLVA